MALYKLDNDSKPIKPGSRKSPAKDGDKFHWRYNVSKSKKYPRDMTKHFWATEAEVYLIIDTFWNGKPKEMATGLKWTDALKKWQEGHPLVSSGHIQTLTRNVKSLCDFFNNQYLTIEDTTKGMFRQWLNDRASVSPATANKSREIIAIAQYAYKELDLLDKPPECAGVGKYKTQEKKKKAIPLEHTGDYLKAAETHYGVGLELIVEFMLFTGVRSTEAAQLTEDRSHDKITVLQKAKGAGKREADVVTDDYIRDIIRRAKAHKKNFIVECQKEIEKTKKGQGQYVNDRNRFCRCKVKIDTLEKYIHNTNHDFVFINNAGSPWNKDTIRRHWKASCENANLEYFVPHELRHTHATLAGGAGFSERFIQAAMRWDDPTMAKRYVHETQNMAKEVAESVRNTLAEALGRKKNDKEISVQVEKLLAEIEISCPHCQKSIQLTPKATK